MKHSLIASSLALSLSFGVAFAQQTPEPAQQPAPAAHQRHAPNPEHQAAELTKKLNLTPDQSSKVEPILAAEDQQVQTLRQNTQLTKKDRRHQMKALHEQTEQQLTGILTPDQMTQFKAMHHNGRHHGESNGEAGQTPSA